MIIYNLFFLSVILLKLPIPTGYNDSSLNIFLNGKIKVPPKLPVITNLTNSGCNKVDGV